MKTAIFKVTETYGDGREKVVYNPMFERVIQVVGDTTFTSDINIYGRNSWEPILCSSWGDVVFKQYYRDIKDGLFESEMVSGASFSTIEHAEACINAFLKGSIVNTEKEIVQIKEQL